MVLSFSIIGLRWLCDRRLVPNYSEEMRIVANTATSVPAWFLKARLGQFIHWGLYSLLGRGEQPMYREHLRPSEYRQLAERFAPRQGVHHSLRAIRAKKRREPLELNARFINNDRIIPEGGSR